MAVFDDDKIKTGYISTIRYDGILATFFSSSVSDILIDVVAMSGETPEDCMGNKPEYELIESKRIKYIEEE